MLKICVCEKNYVCMLHNKFTAENGYNLPSILMVATVDAVLLPNQIIYLLLLLFRLLWDQTIIQKWVK